jgi:hypothetical protein
MKTKQILTSFMVALVALFAIGTVMAGDLNITIDEVSVNDVSGGVSLAGYPEENVPIQVKFTANEDYDDVKLKVWIDGYKSDISTTTARFDVLEDSTYVKKVSLVLPNVNDMDDLDEELTLHVRLSDKNDEVETEYTIIMQRENYAAELLSVEAPVMANAGDVVAVDVVLKNIGSEELEDAFVTVSIADLGIAKKVYFGDLTPQDDCDNDCSKQDARERRVYLIIPTDALSGEYDMVIKASNYDITETVVQGITINGLVVEDDVDDMDNDESVPNSIIVLTVVLIVIFVVLLIVLIVLLTKKPAEETIDEDFGETSYY